MAHRTYVSRLSFGVLLIALGCSVLEARPRHRKSTIVDNVVNGIAIAGTAIGLYKIGSWLMSEPADEDVLDQADMLCDSLLSKYHTMFNFWDRTVGQDYMDPSQRSCLINSTNEDTLMSLDALIGSDKREYQHTVEVDLDIVNQMYDDVTRRRKKLEREYEYDQYCYQLVQDLLKQEGRLRRMMNRLTFVNKYLLAHKGYFALYKECEKLKSSYKRALLVTESGSRDTGYSYDEIDRFIRSSMRHGNGYPYLEFYRTIEQDIKALSNRMNSGDLAYNYSRLNSKSRSLLNSLKWLRDWAYTSRHYTYEYRDYEREQERSRRERARIAELERRNNLFEREFACFDSFCRPDFCDRAFVSVTLY